jgi:hypothetical protein
MLSTESNASVTVAPGATSGKSNSDVGVPCENESEFRFVAKNQSAVLSFVREYPHPSRDPGGPETLPSKGNRLKVMESAKRGDAKQKTHAADREGDQKLRLFIKYFRFLTG